MTAQPRIGVLAGCGGAGASVFAAVLAGCAAGRDGSAGWAGAAGSAGWTGSAGSAGQAFLIDCDPVGGGIDVLLGCERAAGSRWSQVRLRGGGLDPAVLRDCLRSWHQVSVLAVDNPHAVDPAALSQIVAVAAAAGPVVLDIGRWPSPIRAAALSSCDLMILITLAEVRAVTAAAVIAADLDPGRTALVIRGSAPTLPADRIGALLGLPVLGRLGHDPAGRQPVGLDPRRIRRGTRQLAEAVLRRAAEVVGAACGPPSAAAGGPPSELPSGPGEPVVAA